MDMQYGAIKSLPLPYNIFIYREELERGKRNALAITNKKIEITSQLIAESATKLWFSSAEDIEAFTRQMVYKESLLQQQWILSGGLRRFIEIDNFVRDDKWSDINDKILKQIDLGSEKNLHSYKKEDNEIKEKSDFEIDCIKMEVDDMDFEFECDWSSIINKDVNTKEGYEPHCKINWFEDGFNNADIEMSV